MAESEEERKNFLMRVKEESEKAGSQEIPRVTGKFGLGVKMKQGKN